MVGIYLYSKYDEGYIYTIYQNSRVYLYFFRKKKDAKWEKNFYAVPKLFNQEPVKTHYYEHS